MPVKSDLSLGWTKRSVAVSVLLAMEHQRAEAGLRLVRLREARRMTQEDLAHAAGVSVKTISRFENGHHDGRRGTVRRIAAGLGVDEQDITGPPPAPLGLDAGEGDTPVWAQRIEEKIDGGVLSVEQVQELLQQQATLISQQNALLTRQSELLADIEALVFSEKTREVLRAVREAAQPHEQEPSARGGGGRGDPPESG